MYASSHANPYPFFGLYCPSASVCLPFLSLFLCLCLSAFPQPVGLYFPRAMRTFVVRGVFACSVVSAVFT